MPREVELLRYGAGGGDARTLSPSPPPPSSSAMLRGASASHLSARAAVPPVLPSTPHDEERVPVVSMERDTLLGRVSVDVSERLRRAAVMAAAAAAGGGVDTGSGEDERDVRRRSSSPSKMSLATAGYGVAGGGSRRAPKITCKRECCRFYVPVGRMTAITLLIGVLAALAGGLIDYILLWERTSSLMLLDVTDDVFVKYLLWLLLRWAYVVAALTITLLTDNTAAGSGVPEMRVILSGFWMQRFLSRRTFVGKVFAVLCAGGAWLVVGREGPFVHLAALLTALIMRTPCLRSLWKQPTVRVQVLTVAAAAGIATSFGASVSGVLFSIELTSTYYAVRHYWDAFATSLVSGLVTRWVRGMIAGTSEAALPPVVALDSSAISFVGNSYVELGLFAALGVLCGLLSGMIVRTYRLLLHFVARIQPSMDRPRRTRLIFRFVFGLFITAVVTSMRFPMGIGRFMSLTATEHMNDMVVIGSLSSTNSTVAHGWMSLPFAPMSSLTLSAVLTSIGLLLSVLLPVPFGFMYPMMVVGSAIGRLMGELLLLAYPEPQSLFGETIVPAAFAVVGAAALAASGTQTISTSVLVCELTGQLTLIPGVLIGVLFAVITAGFLTEGVFDMVTTFRKLPYMPAPTRAVSAMPVHKIMERDVPYVTRLCEPQELRQQLVRAAACENMTALPVVDSHDNMLLLGVMPIDRLEMALSDQSDTNTINTLNPGAVKPTDRAALGQIAAGNQQQQQQQQQQAPPPPPQQQQQQQQQPDAAYASGSGSGSAGAARDASVPQGRAALRGLFASASGPAAASSSSAASQRPAAPSAPATPLSPPPTPAAPVAPPATPSTKLDLVAGVSIPSVERELSLSVAHGSRDDDGEASGSDDEGGVRVLLPGAGASPPAGSSAAHAARDVRPSIDLVGRVHAPSGGVHRPSVDRRMSASHMDALQEADDRDVPAELNVALTAAAVLVDGMSLAQVHLMFYALRLMQAFVTRGGRLVGRVSRGALHRAIVGKKAL